MKIQLVYQENYVFFTYTTISILIFHSGIAFNIEKIKYTYLLMFYLNLYLLFLEHTKTKK